jgi:hypothetical protein
LLAGLLLAATALLAALSWLLARLAPLARLLSAAALLAALSWLTTTLVLLTRFVVRIHDYSTCVSPH